MVGARSKTSCFDSIEAFSLMSCPSLLYNNASYFIWVILISSSMVTLVAFDISVSICSCFASSFIKICCSLSPSRRDISFLAVA